MNDYVHSMVRKRRYRMTERARSQEETRQRIVEATMQLHEEIGPRATTISAIAERAGVQRLTVYRHFPDETAVFQACTSHWLGLNPPPDPSRWSAIADAQQRLRAALSAFYAYYSATQRMWTVAHRDVIDVPALHGPMAEFAGLVSAVADDVVAHFHAQGRSRRLLDATVQHALTFQVWMGLQEQALNDADKVALVELWLHGVRQAEKRG